MSRVSIQKQIEQQLKKLEKARQHLMMLDQSCQDLEFKLEQKKSKQISYPSTKKVKVQEKQINACTQMINTILKDINNLKDTVTNLRFQRNIYQKEIKMLVELNQNCNQESAKEQEVYEEQLEKDQSTRQEILFMQSYSTKELTTLNQQVKKLENDVAADRDQTLKAIKSVKNLLPIRNDEVSNIYTRQILQSRIKKYQKKVQTRKLELAHFSQHITKIEKLFESLDPGRGYEQIITEYEGFINKQSSLLSMQNKLSTELDSQQSLKKSLEKQHQEWIQEKEQSNEQNQELAQQLKKVQNVYKDEENKNRIMRNKIENLQKPIAEIFDVLQIESKELQAGIGPNANNIQKFLSQIEQMLMNSFIQNNSFQKNLNMLKSWRSEGASPVNVPELNEEPSDELLNRKEWLHKAKLLINSPTLSSARKEQSNNRRKRTLPVVKLKHDTACCDMDRSPLP